MIRKSFNEIAKRHVKFAVEIYGVTRNAIASEIVVISQRFNETVEEPVNNARILYTQKITKVNATEYDVNLVLKTILE